MTYEEVLKNANDEIESATDFYNSLEDDAQKEMAHYAIDGWTLIKNAVEKQIPKKPVIDNYFCCPTCGNEVSDWEIDNALYEQPYCDVCGQRIDWEDNND